jgi:threo-3-hydroxy-L-aspartate ammonia-lyase
MTAPLPTYAEVLAASDRLRGHAHHTPVLSSSTANALFGAQVFLKCENFQRMGAFKFRGAYNALSAMDPALRAKGVIAFSSGNHAQAVALAAREHQTRAVIVMPSDAPAAKVAATKGYGAQVVHYDRVSEDREALTKRIAQEQGLAIIPPYENPYVIAGAGTAVKELIEEVGKPAPLDALFVCVGGGGLLAGSCLAAKALNPDCRIYGVEPEAGNDAQQSFRSGVVVKIATPKTIADGAQTQSVGAMNFSIIQRDVSDMLTVSDAQLISALRFMAERMKMVVEPTGALGFAAALLACQESRLDLKGKRIGIVISGGNIDLSQLSRYLA